VGAFILLLPLASKGPREAMNYLWVAIGSALGGMARYWFSGISVGLFGEWFPWGTMIVNVLGSLLIGLVAALSDAHGPLLIRPELRVFMMVGLCGGYTTFSSFSLQTFELIKEGEWLWAGANSVLSVALCLGAVWLGYAAIAAVAR
jgi:fluoride exporter